MASTAAGFGLYLLVLAVLAVRAGRTAGRSEAEYFLAGRSLGVWVVALSAVASGRSAWLLMGMTGLAYVHGVSAVWFLPGYILAELLLFLGPGRRLRRATGDADDVTVGDYFASRFPPWARTLQTTFALLVIVFLTAYVSGQLVAGAKAMDQVFAEGSGEGTTIGLWVTGLVVLLYVVLGGFKAVSWTDVAQVGLMLLALVGLPLAAIDRAGGVQAVLAGLGDLAGPLAKGGAFVATGLAVGLGSPGNPHILVRYMSVSDESKLTRAAFVGTTWNVVMGVGALWIGLAGRVLHPELGTEGAETIFPLLAGELLPAFLFGLVMAALLAAIMSTVDSQVLVVASAVTRDLRRALSWAAPSPRTAARLGRIVCAALMLVALGFAQVNLLAEGREGGAPVITGLVNKLVLFAWGGLGAAIGPAILLSLYDRRATGVSTFAAMVTGGATAILWKGVVAPAMKALPEAPTWWPWISYELTVAFPLALVVGWGVARVTRPGARAPIPAP